MSDNKFDKVVSGFVVMILFLFISLMVLTAVKYTMIVDQQCAADARCAAKMEKRWWLK